MISAMVIGLVMASNLAIAIDSTQVLDSTYTISTPTGTGAGFLMEDGTVFTAAHVVENYEFVELTASLPSQETSKGKVIYSDPISDIAVISPVTKLLGSPLAFSEKELKVGDLVFASGSPIGSTIVSRGSVLDPLNDWGMIESEIPIEQGNSGGPLVNEDGSLVGMIVSMSTEYQNTAFAVPLTELEKVYILDYEVETNSVISQIDLTKVNLSPLYVVGFVSVLSFGLYLMKKNAKLSPNENKIVIVLEKEENNVSN